MECVPYQESCTPPQKYVSNKKTKNIASNQHRAPPLPLSLSANTPFSGMPAGAHRDEHYFPYHLDDGDDATINQWSMVVTTTTTTTMTMTMTTTTTTTMTMTMTMTNTEKCGVAMR